MNESTVMNDQDSGSENSIAAVAARIQERAHEVASERANVELAKAELKHFQILLEQESKKHNHVRRTMLSTVRSRHGVEMELWKLRDEQEDYVHQLEEYKRETQQAKEELAQVHASWEDTVRDVYVEHDLHRELYRRCVQDQIQQRKECIRQREQRLVRLAQETKAFQQETKQMMEEAKQLEQNIVEMDSREAKEDEEIAALSMQIRSTISKVSECDEHCRVQWIPCTLLCSYLSDVYLTRFLSRQRSSLRRKVRDAEEARQKANAEMTMWEQKRMDVVNRY